MCSLSVNLFNGDHLTALLEIETPENEGEKLLLTKEFMKNCRVTFSDPRRMHEARLQEFPIKHLNIVDPLKDNNNLGRSVNQGTWSLFLAGSLFGPSLRGSGDALNLQYSIYVQFLRLERGKIFSSSVSKVTMITRSRILWIIKKPAIICLYHQSRLKEERFE